MSTEQLLQRITVDPEVFHGKPCVRGLRYPVTMLLELLSSGMSTDEVLPTMKTWSAKTCSRHLLTARGWLIPSE